MSIRLSGPLVVLDQADARHVEHALAVAAAWLRRNGLPVPWRADLVADIRAVALATSDRTSDPLPKIDVAYSEPTVWITTTQAGKRLGISPRRVVQMLHSESPDLVGRQRGANSAWEVQEQSVDDLIARRTTERTAECA